MDDAWQSQDMGPGGTASGISIPTDDLKGSGSLGGLPSASDVQDWQSTRSPQEPPRRSRSRSPGARGGDRDRDRSGREVIANNPGNNLHVSGLTPKVENRDLEAIFMKVGRVQKASVMYDPHSRDSRGFAFVTMETAEEADAAIKALNATEQWGKVISVEKARRGRARTPTPGKYFGPPKRGDNERPYDPRPYDNRYREDRDGRYREDRRGGRYDDRDRTYDRRDRYEDRRGYDRGDRGERGGHGDRYGGGGGERGGRYEDRRY